jgi:protein-L-isoaspartate O-methyltransferase
MTEWVRRLDPAATDAQMLAARAHHLRRWALPRTSYPEGRAGYLRWRTRLKVQHGEDVAAILTAVGYDADTVARVVQIVRKDDLRTDPAVQTHEDALCLVFLETQLTDLIDQLGDDKAVDVVRKTAAKMSAPALVIAGELPMTDQDRDVVVRASR